MNARRWDVLLLLILVTARVRIDTLADLVAPRPPETIRKIPLLDSLLSPQAWELLQDWMTDPYSLLLIGLTFLLVVVYLVLDAARAHISPLRLYRAKLGLVYGIVLTTVVANSLYLTQLRHVAGPASFAHDGGVIHTEEVIQVFLQGKNPYVEEYKDTPLAQWGRDFRTEVYHFPYLPFTFLFSTPFYLASHALVGWYDQRFVYLVLFIILLALAPQLARDPLDKLGLTMVLGLNPIMGSDIIFGQNEIFFLFWVFLAVLFLYKPLAYTRAAVALGLAAASKPTAWFILPFYFLYLLRDQKNPPAGFGICGRVRIVASTWLRRVMPLLIVFLALVGPYLLWDAGAFVDDVWDRSSGTSPTSYQIRGWGASNFVLALGWVKSRLDYFPFWIPEIVVCAPLLAFLLWRQARHNTLNALLTHSAILALAFFYFSRFLNEDYLGFILALFALGYFVDDRGSGTE